MQDFGAWLWENRHIVYAYVNKRLWAFSPEDREDAFQEVWWYVYSKRLTYDPSRGLSLNSWAFMMADYGSRTVLSRLLRDKSRALEGALTRGAPCDLSTRNRELLDEFLLLLSERQRTVMEMTAAGYRDTQIGELIGATRVQVNRIRYNITRTARHFAERRGL